MYNKTNRDITESIGHLILLSIKTFVHFQVIISSIRKKVTNNNA